MLDFSARTSHLFLNDPTLRQGYIMTKSPRPTSGIDSTPVVATWEYWTVARMLVSTHGDDAEAHVESKLKDAALRNSEADIIVWSGIRTQLEKIRKGG